MKVRILIIDDDEDLLFIAQQFLSTLDPDFELIQASEAQYALQLLDEEQFDAVICDFYLGPEEMNGLEILEWMRDRGSRTPFIIFTGRSREEVAIQALNLGADYYLEKGDDLESLFVEIGHHVKNVVRNRRTEEALQESELRYRTLVQSISNLIIVLDANDHIIQYHSTAIGDFLDSPRDFLGQHISDTLPSVIAEPYTELTSKVRIDGIRRSFEYEIEMRGEKRWYNADIDLHEDGKSIVVIVAEITDRKMAENELKQSERDWKNTFDSIPDFVSVLNSQFEIIKANKTMADSLGVRPKELVGRKCYEIMHKANEPFPGCPHLETIRTGQPTTYEMHDPIIGVPCLVTTSPIRDETGNQVGVVHIAKDISDRIVAEEAIQESETRFKALFQFAGIGMAHVSMDGSVLAANRALKEFLGYNLDELAKMTTDEFTHPEDVEKDNAALQKMLNSEEERYQIEKRYMHKDGSVRWGRLTVSLIRDADGTPQSTIGMVEDITDQKQMESFLEREKTRAEMYLDMAGTLILATDSDFNVNLINEEGCRILGRTRAEILGKNWIEEFIPDSQQEEVRDYMRGIISGETEPTPLEPGPVLDENGNVHWIQWSDVVLTGTKGHPSGILSAGADITEKRRAEEELRASEAKFRLIFEHAPIGMSHAGMKGELFRVNKALEKMLGYTSDELEHMSAKDLTYLDDWITEMKLNEELLEGARDSYSLEKRYFHRDGHIVWGRLNVSLRRNEEGNPEFVIGMVEDISEQVRMREEIESSEELLGTIFDESPISIDVYDSNGVFIRANKACLDLFGVWSESSLEGHNIFNDPNLSKEDKQRMRNGETLRFEKIFNFDRFREHTSVETFKSGEAFHESIIAPLGLDHSGHPSGFLIQTLDRTERNRIENQLKESETKFRATFEQAPIGMTIVGVDDVVQEANQVWLDMIGYTIDEVRRIRIADFTHPEDAMVDAELLEEVLSGNRDSFWMEKRYIRKDGRTVWVNVTVACIRDQKGKPMYVVGMIEDTTSLRDMDIDWKLTKQRLLDEKRFIESSLDAQRDTFLVFEADTDKAVRWNKSFRETTGYTDEEIASLPAPDAYLDDVSLKEVLALRQQVINGGNVTVELSLITKKGKALPFEFTGSAMFDEQGQLKYIITVGRDTTKRKESERRWKEQLGFIENILESLSHPFYVIDPKDYTIKLANKAARLGPLGENSTCYSLTHHRASPCNGLQHPCPISEVAKTRQPAYLEHQHYDEHGQLRDLEIHAHPVFNENNDIVLMIEYALDVTEEKKAQRALEESEKRFRELYEDAPLSYQTLDENGNIIDVNPAWLNATGYSKEEVVGRYFGDFLTAKSRLHFPACFNDFKRTGAMGNIEFEINRQDGAIIIGRFTGKIAFHNDGRFKQSHCIFQDVTEWKKADDLLKRQKEELGELANIMSHDLGNRMKSIRSLVSLLQREDNEEILYRIDSIAQQSAELLQASAELADAGMVVEKRERVDLNEVLKSIAETTVPEGVSFQMDRLPIVLGSPERLGQIFQNLIDNALEHGNPTAIEVRREESPGGTEIIVQNDGAMIPDQIKPKIWRRGFSTKDTGTGLGLSIVKKLVEAHGWRIQVDQGDKTAFRIVLGTY
ncbi:MAG: PAS domain S-box protein [Candidatus Thorarchaeota archaeon]